MESCNANPPNCEDTPMQNDDNTSVSTQAQTSALSANQAGLTVYRSPNLPPTHYILLKNPIGGSLTAENCLVVDFSQLQNQNLTFVPSIIQPIVNPPTEEQG